MTTNGIDRSGSAGGSGATVTPVDTNVVDAKGDLIVGTADNAVDNLTAGTNETRIVADSTQTLGLKYVADTTNYAIAAKGDLLVGTAADTVTAKTVGANGTIPMARSADTTGLAYIAALVKGIYGLTYSNSAGGDATNDIDFAVGGAMDATGAYWMTLASALTKQSDAVWAVGTGAGGLDLIGSAGNNDFYVWLIARSDTGVVDLLFSLSSTAPTMPSNYDFKRLVGWFRRSAGAIELFKTVETEGGGLHFTWVTPTLDVNLNNTLTTARRTDAVHVPQAITVFATMRVDLLDTISAFNAFVGCTEVTDAAPTGALINTTDVVPANVTRVYVREIKIIAGVIAARADLVTVDSYAVATESFRWSRR